MSESFLATSQPSGGNTFSEYFLGSSRPRGPFQGCPISAYTRYFNKHIAVYFEHGTSFTEKKNGWKPKVHYTQSMCRYIYRHWVRMYDEHPPFQRRHFLAKPIRFVEDDGKITPADRVTDIPFGQRFHQSLYDSIAARENDNIFDGSVRKTFKQQRYELAHLFRSLFMVVGHHQDNQPLEEDMWKCRDYMIRPASQDEPRSHGTSESWKAMLRRWSEWRLSRFSVLLVKTGDDAHFSEPIRFQPLFDKGLVLPPMRGDCLAGSAVRVRLDTAMEFVGV